MGCLDYCEEVLVCADTQENRKGATGCSQSENPRPGLKLLEFPPSRSNRAVRHPGDGGLVLNKA